MRAKVIKVSQISLFLKLCCQCLPGAVHVVLKLPPSTAGQKEEEKQMRFFIYLFTYLFFYFFILLLLFFFTKTRLTPSPVATGFFLHESINLARISYLTFPFGTWSILNDCARHWTLAERTIREIFNPLSLCYFMQCFYSSQSRGGCQKNGRQRRTRIRPEEIQDKHRFDCGQLTETALWPKQEYKKYNVHAHAHTLMQPIKWRHLKP